MYIVQQGFIVVETSLEGIIKMNDELGYVIKIRGCGATGRRTLLDTIHDLAGKVEVGEQGHE